MNKKFQLRCIEGPLIGKVFSLTDSEMMTMGRGKQNYLFLDSPRVSRKHADFLLCGNFLFLRDLGSQNGSYLNGKQIQGQGSNLFIELKDQDKISLGDYIFIVESTESAGQTFLTQCKTRLDFLEAMAELILRTTPSERICLLDYDPQQKTLIPCFFKAKNSSSSNSTFEPSMMVLHSVMNERKSILSIDAGQDDRFVDGSSLTSQVVRSVLCVPMLHDGNLKGAIYVDTQQGDHRLDPSHQPIFETLAEWVFIGQQKFT